MNNIPINSSVAAMVVLSEREGEMRILLMKRAKEGFWCHVAGSIEAGETAWQTALRELQEETGLRAETLYTAEHLEQFYEAGRNVITIVPAFLCFVDSDAEVQLNDEHLDYRWCTLEEALELTGFPNQHSLYQHVWRYFVEREPNPRMRIDL